MSSPHCLDKLAEYDQISCLSQYSHPDPVCLIENSSFQGFWVFHEDYSEFHDPLYDYLEAYFFASSFDNNKFQYFLMLSKKEDTYEGEFTRSFHGLFDYNVHCKGKNVNWLDVVAMAYIFAHRKDLLFVGKVIQAIFFSLSHYFYMHFNFLYLCECRLEATIVDSLEISLHMTPTF